MEDRKWQGKDGRRRVGIGKEMGREGRRVGRGRNGLERREIVALLHLSIMYSIWKAGPD